MPYQQYTHCTDSYDGMCGLLPDLWYALGHALVGALIGSGLGALLSGIFGPGAVLFGAALGFTYGFFDGLCDRFHNHRLLCIEHDQCAVGKIVFQEPASAKSGFDAIDNDYSLNLLLTPHVSTDTRDSVRNDGLQGYHLLRQRFVDLSYQGYVDVPSDYLSRFTGDIGTAIKEGAGGKWSLHCEFEGSRLHYICSYGEGFAPLAAAAAVGAYFACGDGLWGLLCALLALLLIMLISFGLGWAAGGDGSPADSAVDPNSGTVEDGDCIVVSGDLVYDAGHCEGWHEIHPVKYLQKIEGAVGDPDRPSAAQACVQGNLDDPAFRSIATDFINRWCEQLKQAAGARTKAAQQLPENSWYLHPAIDGCEPPSPPPAPA